MQYRHCARCGAYSGDVQALGGAKIRWRAICAKGALDRGCGYSGQWHCADGCEEGGGFNACVSTAAVKAQADDMKYRRRAADWAARNGIEVRTFASERELGAAVFDWRETQRLIQQMHEERERLGV